VARCKCRVQELVFDIFAIRTLVVPIDVLGSAVGTGPEVVEGHGVVRWRRLYFRMLCGTHD
jgi:hypothetical protein